MPQDYKDMFPPQKPIHGTDARITKDTSGNDEEEGLQSVSQGSDAIKHREGVASGVAAAGAAQKYSQPSGGAAGVHAPRFRGGGLLEGRAAGGFKFEYKLLAGRQLPPATLGTGSRDGGVVQSSAGDGNMAEQGRRQAPAERMRPTSARGVGTSSNVGSVQRDVGISFPASKKKRPASASVMRRDDTLLGTRFAGSGGGAGGGGLVGSSGGGGLGSRVPAPPSTSSPFAFNTDALPGGPIPDCRGAQECSVALYRVVDQLLLHLNVRLAATRLRPTVASKPKPTLWFKPPAPSRGFTAIQDADPTI